MDLQEGAGRNERKEREIEPAAEQPGGRQNPRETKGDTGFR